MRKFIFTLLFLPSMLLAQPAEFGYFSLAEVMDALPENSAAQDDYNSLLSLCDEEIAFCEETLTRAYVSFLDGQQTFPEPILRKRQKELQEMVDRSVILRDELKEHLAQAHDSLFAPIIEKIDAAVERVCLRSNLAYAIDTDKSAYRFINPNFGVEITDLVIQEIISPKPVEKMERTEQTVVEETATESIEQAAIEEAVAEEQNKEIELFDDGSALVTEEKADSVIVTVIEE